MRQRCCNPYDDAWEHYGGRGIRVCWSWLSLDGFANFLADMGSRPPAMTLDRIDNDGNYEPGNCRWATWSTQMHNRRKRKGASSKYRGVYVTRKDNFAAQFRVDSKNIHLGTFPTELLAAQAYDTVASKHFGSEACTNFQEVL